MYLSSQLFFETPRKTLKFQEPRKVNAATDKNRNMAEWRCLCFIFQCVFKQANCISLK